MYPKRGNIQNLRNIIEVIKNGELHLGRETNHYGYYNGSFSRFHVCSNVTPVVSDKGVEVEGEIVSTPGSSSFRKLSCLGESTGWQLEGAKRVRCSLLFER